MNDKNTDREIISYMSKTMGKSFQVCSFIFNNRTRHDKDLMRKKHLYWKIRKLQTQLKRNTEDGGSGE